MGRPPPRGLARVRMSGVTPACSNANILPGAPEAALDLVEDEERAALAAERREALQELRRRGPHAALALDRLDHHGGGLVGRRPRSTAARSFHGQKRTPGQQRLEGLAVLRRSRWSRARPWSGRGTSARSTTYSKRPCGLADLAARTSWRLPRPRCPSCRRRPCDGKGEGDQPLGERATRARCGRGCSRGSAAPPACLIAATHLRGRRSRGRSRAMPAAKSR